jgi:hypothetical protein
MKPLCRLQGWSLAGYRAVRAEDRQGARLLSSPGRSELLFLGGRGGPNCRPLH